MVNSIFNSSRLSIFFFVYQKKINYLLNRSHQFWFYFTMLCSCLALLTEIIFFFVLQFIHTCFELTVPSRFFLLLFYNVPCTMYIHPKEQHFFIVLDFKYCCCLIDAVYYSVRSIQLDETEVTINAWI